MYDATSPCDAGSPRLVPRAAEPCRAPGWGCRVPRPPESAAVIAFARRDGRTRLPASTRRRRLRALFPRPERATCRRRPRQRRRRPGRRRPAAIAVDVGEAAAPWSPARPPRRSTARPAADCPGRDAAGRGAGRLARMAARRRRSCSTAPACGAACGSSSPGRPGACSARSWCSAGSPRASARAGGLCSTGSSVRRDGRWPGPTPPAGRRLRARARRPAGLGGAGRATFVYAAPDAAATGWRRRASSGRRRRARRRHARQRPAGRPLACRGPACAAARFRRCSGPASARARRAAARPAALGDV